MLKQIREGEYNKAFAGFIATAGADLAMQAGVHLNEVGQVVINIPTDIPDALMKSVAVAFFVWQIANRKAASTSS